MAHIGVPQAPIDHSTLFARASRQLRSSARAVPIAVLAVGAMVTAACAPPNSLGGSSDGGVSVTTVAAASTGAPIDVALTDAKGLDGPMAVTPFATTAVAGDVTFTVKNFGTIEHEMLVLKTDTPFDKIPIADSGDPPVPVNSGADKIDEAANVGETGDPNLQPGDTRTFTATGLTAGNYVLVCNIAKHYGLGMRAAFTVTGTAAPATTTPATTAPAPTSTTAAPTPTTAAGSGTVAVTASDAKGLNGPMTLVPATTSAPAGDVTFVVKNTGTVEHEMIVLKTDTPFDKIPIADSGDPPEPVKSGADKIDEADSVGETGDPNLQPGDTRTFTLTGLSPGNYVLVCNIAKHYGLGMRTAFALTAAPTPTTAAPTPTTAAGSGTVAVTASDTKGLNGPMTLVPATPSAPAGDVTFVVKNTGTVEHEMIVLKTDTPFDKIPIADSGDPPEPVKSGADKIDEADSVGETGDPNLQPGDTRTFTLTGLSPGNYVLVCNIAKHYGLGMRVAFTVT